MPSPTRRGPGVECSRNDHGYSLGVSTWITTTNRDVGMAFERRYTFVDNRPPEPAGVIGRDDDDNAAGQLDDNKSPNTPVGSGDASSLSSSGDTNTAARNNYNGPARATLPDRKPPRPPSQ
jgi:hypothetical protein